MVEFGLTGNITRRITAYDNGISCIDTGFLRPQLAACFLMQQDDAVAIIETGTAPCVDTILEVLRYKNIRPGDVRYIMPTHVHLDHAGGAGQLMQAFPDAILVIHPRGARHMIDPSRLWQGVSAVYGEENMQRLYGELLPVAGQRIMVAGDGFELDLNGRSLLFLDTPGHARHHYSIYDELSRGFFTGDTFGMAYRELYSGGRPYMMPTTTPVQFDPDAWSKTLDRYLEFEPERMFVTHFGEVTDVTACAEELRGRILQYAELARQHETRENRLALIKQAITDQTMKEVVQAGCTMPPAAVLGFLQMDFDLNAAGLDVWLSTQ